jgi:hypothetical protein
MKTSQSSLFCTPLILLLLFIGCTHSVNEPEKKEMPPACKAICGQAFLQGYNDHRGIFIYNRNHVGSGGLTRTDNEGNFELPLPTDGRYTLFATHSLFFPDTAVVEIADSSIKEQPRMALVQYLKVKIIPDTSVFFLSDSIRLNIMVTNLFDKTVYGPEQIRYDQLRLRDIQDTTKAFARSGPRHLPHSVLYRPLETKLFRVTEKVLNYRLIPLTEESQKVVPSPGMYQLWLADLWYVDSSQPFDEGNFSFGDSFNLAKGWAKVQLK